MNNPKDMLVSDERLRELRDESENMIVFGREVRAIYEAELTKLRSERDELVGALGALLEGRKNDAYGTAWSEAREVFAKHKPE